MRLAYLAAMTLAAGCATPPSPAERANTANRLAAAHGWQAQSLNAGHFRVRAYLPVASASDQLVVYLEGDGLAWLTPTHPSNDPTPVQPLALQLALAQPSGTAAYLARPCQYMATQPNCALRYWTDARFAAEVVDSLDQAIEQLKTRYAARSLVLVGYSGGGTLALLLAARRTDVQRIITVAGNLDPDAWADFHHLRPLRQSLNPTLQRAALAHIPQQHLSGEHDQVVPTALTLRFNDVYPAGAASRVLRFADYDHQCCWARDWPQIWRMLQDMAPETR